MDPANWSTFFSVENFEIYETYLALFEQKRTIVCLNNGRNTTNIGLDIQKNGYIDPADDHFLMLNA